jgi:hypothetical protein
MRLGFENFSSKHGESCYRQFLLGKTSSFLLIAVIFLAVFWRWWGLPEHTTYIDELIVLTDGRWSVRDSLSNIPAKNALEYAYRIASHAESSYAPLQFVFTYFLLGERQLSWDSLVGARVVSCIVSVIGVLLLLLVARGVLRIYEPIKFLPSLVILACSKIAILNSHLAYPYSFVVTGGLICFYLLFVAVWSPCFWKRGLAALSVGILPLCAYQLIFYSSACFAVIAFTWVGRWIKGRKTLCKIVVDSSVLIFLAGSLIGLTWMLKTTKMQLGVAWWVASYVFKSDSDGLRTCLRHAIQSFDALVSPSLGSIGLVFVTIPALGLVLGFIASIPKIWGMHRHVLLFIFLAAVLIFSSYVLGSTPLSPTRHSLVFLPLILVVCMISMDTLLCWMGGSTVSRKIHFSVSVWVICVCAVALYDQLLDTEVRRETWDARLIHEIAQQNGINSIVSSHWDYSKVYMMLSDLGVVDSYKIHGVVNSAQVPSGPFILVGQNPELFRAIYELSGRPELVAKKQLEKIQSFDFEPSALVTYWPNRFSVWIVRHRDS